MTSLLLDTHAYVWAVTAPSKLSVDARRSLSDATMSLLVSAASAWEMAIKFRAGRWPEAEPLIRQHDDLVERLGARPLAIDARAAVRAGTMNWSHLDPFDRMLAAQSMLTGARLVSRDAAFSDLPGLDVLW